MVLPWIGMGAVVLITGRDLGAGFQPAYLLLAVAASLHVIAALRGPGESSRRPDPLPRQWWVFLAASFGVVALSGVGLWLRPGEAPAAVRWLRLGKQSLQLLLMFGFLLLPLLWLRTARQWELAGRWLGVGLLFQVVYSALQTVHFFQPVGWFARLESWFTSNPSILSGSLELFLGDSFSGIPRLRGTACEPLYLGNYLLLVVPFLLLSGSGTRWRRPLIVAGLLLLLATWARGAYLAAALAVLAGLILARRSGDFRLPAGWWRWLAGGIVALAGGAVVLWGPHVVLLPFQRLWQSIDLEDWSNLTRIYSMQAGWRAFLLSPLVGVGWGQFAFHFPVLVDASGLNSQFSWPVVNNFPLQILCETGLVGFLFFMTICFLLGRSVWRAVSPATVVGEALGRSGRLRVMVMTVAVIGIWGQLLTFSQYNLPHIWVAPGFLLAALHGVESDVSAERNTTGQTPDEERFDA
ncbi:MAG: O-antigen ligase family protein [bacterium]